ncbi:MAG: ATP-binding protein [Deltaproteobacteria bacterium]|nr:ATP-binding protein [Deltaproteobacteria bacterium]
MLPKTLSDWTYEVIQTLCAAGQTESDRHDFKFNLAALHNATKICCAFANTFGGFIVVGVKDSGPRQFEILGIDPDKELYGNLLSKVKADPDIDISPPKTISVPGADKLLYIFEVPQSTRRPHLPSPADQRIFWKRQGSACIQMTLEEIRYQMNTYEEKREKLALLLIDLHNKLRSLEDQAAMPNAHYNGDMFFFEIIDRVVAEAFAILKADASIFSALDTIKRRFMLLNAEKQKMLAIQALSYGVEFKTARINDYRQTARETLPGVALLTEQIERSLKEKFGIDNPYKV